MEQYTEKQIQDTLKIIEASIVNCEKVRCRLKEGSASFSLNTNRLRALYLSKAVLSDPENAYPEEELKKAITQISSIRSKSTTGRSHAKEGSATATRFTRLIHAMNILLDSLQDAVDKLD